MTLSLSLGLGLTTLKQGGGVPSRTWIINGKPVMIGSFYILF